MMGKMIAARQSGDNKRYTDEKHTKYAENKEINKEGDDPVRTTRPLKSTSSVSSVLISHSMFETMIPANGRRSAQN
jgi:hypothetical protein